MSRIPFVPLLALSLATASPLASVTAQVVVPPSSVVFDVERFADNQLDNLVGPIALYPDALLAQVLVAATFPDQVEDAARWVREHGTAGIDEQSWDVSVKSVAHYPSALNMMADKGDWTATLGRAYAYQSSDVMTAVQRMRRLADTQGNLVSTAQQQVVRESNQYVIVPAQPRVIYVPVYDPIVVYSRPIFTVGFSSRYWSFGVGFPIGGWLTYDLDWRRRAVYYNGWDDVYVGYGGGWRARSRPFILVTNIYVSPRYRDVVVNRNVVYRTVNYRNVDRYAGYHRDVVFAARRDGNRDGYRDGYRDGNRDGNRDGRNDGRDNGRGRDVTTDNRNGRSAQPRTEGASASPDGYRNGLPQREAARGDGGRGDGGRGNGVMLGQPMVSERRREPVPPTMTTRDPSNESRGGESRGRDLPRRPSEPSSPPAAPQARSPEPRSAPTRSAQPRTPSDGNRAGRERREK